MPKIARKTQKILGGGSADNGQFGSAQAGTKILSNDPAVIQALPAWENGWNSATVSGLQLPTLEEMQGVQFVQTYQLAYLFQEGVPEYDSGTTYYQYSIVKKTGSYQLYGSLADNNTGNALTDPTKWVLLFDLGKLNNYTATTNPTVNDDSADGYGVGSFWLNQTSGGVYVCFSASVGAAVWRNPASPEIADNLFRVVGSSDATKKLAFEVDGFTTATTRTVTVPNKDGTMAMTSDLSGVGGSFSNLVIMNNAGTPNTQVDVTASEAVMSDNSGKAIRATSVSLTINCATTGANGLDTGSLGASTWYYVFLISDGTNTRGLMSLSSTAPTMPESYTYKKRIGAMRTNGSSILVSTIQNGVRTQYRSLSSSAVLMASGSTGNPTSGPTLTAVAIGGFVPPTAATLFGMASSQNTVGSVVVGANNAFGVAGLTTNPPPLTIGQASGAPSQGATFSLNLESTNIYWASNSSSAGIMCIGWQDNL